jgi:biotin-(acetyl-CoA carboxylase) ligase
VWVVGIGLNCLQHRGHFSGELMNAASSLELIANHAIDRTTVARELLKSLDHWMGDAPALDDGRVHEAWMSYALPLGARVRLRSRGETCTGRTVEVDPTGGLIIDGDDGRRAWFDPLRTTLLRYD